jgi:hypothetical protein
MSSTETASSQCDSKIHKHKTLVRICDIKLVQHENNVEKPIKKIRDKNATGDGEVPVGVFKIPSN